MIKLTLSIIKVVLFCVLTLALGAWVPWNGKPINRYFDALVAHVSPPATILKNAQSLSKDLIQSSRSQAQVVMPMAAKKNEKTPSMEASHPNVTQNERQKIKNLILELNREDSSQ
jgi:hypothetical protein